MQVLSRAEEGDYALSPEESAAEDDADAVEERCGLVKATQRRSACLWGTMQSHIRHCLLVGGCKSPEEVLLALHC